MNKVQFTVLVSSITASLIIATALLSSSSMANEVESYDFLNWLMLGVQFFIIAALCSWPGYKMFLFATNEQFSPLLYSCLSVMVCTLFISAISAAPAEGVGYYTIFCVLAMWACYPVSRLFKNVDS